MEAKYKVGQTVWFVDKYLRFIQEITINSINITAKGVSYTWKGSKSAASTCCELVGSKEEAITVLRDCVKKQHERLNLDLLKEIKRLSDE